MDERAMDDPGDARTGAPRHAPPDPDVEVVCREVVELVTDYLEGVLPVDVHAAVERHLEECPPCVVYVEQMRTTAAAVREVPVESIDPRLRIELVSAFRDLIPRSGGGPF